jgi:hypothetical protein
VPETNPAAIDIDYTLHTADGRIEEASTASSQVPRVGESLAPHPDGSYEVVDVLWHITDYGHCVQITARERSWHAHIKDALNGQEVPPACCSPLACARRGALLDMPGMWRERIRNWAADAEFSQPADELFIKGCADALGEELPQDLAALLREADGVYRDGFDLVYSTNKIIRENLFFRGHAEFRRLYMPFDPLLFFSEEGNGDQFAFVMRDRPADVFHWDHESDSRTMVAPDLARYLEWQLTGQLALP